MSYILKFYKQRIANTCQSDFWKFGISYIGWKSLNKNFYLQSFKNFYPKIASLHLIFPFLGRCEYHEQAPRIRLNFPSKLHPLSCCLLLFYKLWLAHKVNISLIQMQIVWEKVPPFFVDVIHHSSVVRPHHFMKSTNHEAYVLHCIPFC